MVHVADIADFIGLLVQEPKGGLFILDDGEPYNVAQIQAALIGQQQTRLIPIPRLGWRALGFAGDALGRVVNPSPPFTTADYKRLFDNAIYRGTESRASGFRPTRRLLDGPMETEVPTSPNRHRSIPAAFSPWQPEVPPAGKASRSL